MMLYPEILEQERKKDISVKNGEIQMKSGV